MAFCGVIENIGSAVSLYSVGASDVAPVVYKAVFIVHAINANMPISVLIAACIPIPIHASPLHIHKLPTSDQT